MARYNGWAVFSECGVYRYELGGDIGSQLSLAGPAAGRVVKAILWILINPSIATDAKDDQTIGTVVTFSELWGYNRVMVGNLFGMVATDATNMWNAYKGGGDIVGSLNNGHLSSMAERARASGGIVMGGWGAGTKVTNARLRTMMASRVREVHALIGDLHCLKTNQDGSPVHPLYQPHTLTAVPWKAAA